MPRTNSKSTPTPRPARRTKTARERAEEALGVEQRKVDRLQKAVNHQSSLLAQYRAELSEARRLLAYAESHPALQPDEHEEPSFLTEAEPDEAGA